MLLNDIQIQKLCDPYFLEGKPPMLDPFFADQVREENGRKIISYGCSSFGYDMRCSEDFRIFTNVNSVVVDPKRFSEKSYVPGQILQDEDGSKYCIIPPNSYALTASMEHFNMPSNVTAVCLGKSTLARAGCIVNITPLEAGWVGYLTIEISNATPLPCKVYCGEGIAQVLFFQGITPRVTYADRAGKYQNQLGVVPSRL